MMAISFDHATNYHLRVPINDVRISDLTVNVSGGEGRINVKVQSITAYFSRQCVLYKFTINYYPV